MLHEAPIDDEPETDAERQLVQEAREELTAGRIISRAEIRNEFGE